jgi:hypothetical protein
MAIIHTLQACDPPQIALIPTCTYFNVHRRCIVADFSVLSMVKVQNVSADSLFSRPRCRTGALIL